MPTRLRLHKGLKMILILPDRTILYPEVQKKLGISVSEYRVLDFLSRVAGEPEDPFFTVREISRKCMGAWLGLSKASVIRIINSLVEKKLLKRTILVPSKAVYPSWGWYKIIRPYREKESGQQKQEDKA